MMTTSTTVVSSSKRKRSSESSDPRTEEFVIKYDKENFSKGDQISGTQEFYQLISVIIGMIAFITRHKLACWVALFFYYTSSVNARADGRIQNLMTGVSIVLISFINLYMGPPEILQNQQPEQVN